MGPLFQPDQNIRASDALARAAYADLSPRNFYCKVP